MKSAAIFAALFLFTSCGPKPSPTDITVAPPSKTPVTLQLAAAADLRGACEEIGATYEKTSGVKTVCVFGATGQLTTQIEQGAPYDLFLAASKSYIDRLAELNLVVPDSPKVYALGKLVLWLKPGTNRAKSDLSDLLGPSLKRIAIADPKVAPYGKLAQGALEKAGLWKELEPKIVYGENVSQVAQYVRTGNADAALLPNSFAAEFKGNVAPVPEKLYTPLQQTLTVLKKTSHPEEAKGLANFILNKDGRAILERKGFVVP